MTRPVKVEVVDDDVAVAREAARIVASESRLRVAECGRFVMAMSGGRTPWKMLRALADEVVPWSSVHVFQVDERIAPAGDPDRNLTLLQESLLSRVPLPPGQVHAMQVEDRDLYGAVVKYERTLARIAGEPPVLDLTQLGLGTDGHTASLVPGDPVLDITDRNVGLTAAYRGRGRMTLTLPMIGRSRMILWVVTGAEKATMLNRLLSSDISIPAGRIAQGRAVLIADRAAAGRT